MTTEWVNDSLVKSQCLFPKDAVWENFHLPFQAHSPSWSPTPCPSRGWPVDQPQPPASLASPSIWQLGWVCTFIGLYVIGLAVILSNTFSMQFPSLGSTNFPLLLLLPAQDLEGLPGATSHRYCIEAMQIWFMFIYACITFGNIFRDQKLAGEFVTGKKTYEEDFLSQEWN